MLAPSSRELPAVFPADDMYERFISFADISKSSASTYRRSLRQLRLFLNERNITRPVRQDILEYKQWLLETKKPTTAQSYLSAAKVFFAWLSMETGYPDITRNIKSVKIDRVFKRDYLTSDMLRNVLAGIDTGNLSGKRDRALISLIVACGLRTCEAAAALIGDIAPRAGRTVVYVRSKGKTEKTDYVILPPAVESCIRSYLSARKPASNTEPLFVSMSNINRGQRLSTRSVSAICKEAFLRSGYVSDRLTAHSLRHSAITLAMESGRTLHEVQLFARHASPSTTAIYAHELERAENTCSAAIADSIF